MSTYQIKNHPLASFAVVLFVGGLGLSATLSRGRGRSVTLDSTPEQNALSMINEGRKTFRSDTFRDEAFWGQTLQLHKAVEGALHGGVGPGLSPSQALNLGLKVDVDRLPVPLQNALTGNQIDLNDPQITLDLLRLKAVVGVSGFVTAQSHMESIGIQCALCHSTVDDSLMPGIGHRLDGWANRDLDIGKIAALAPDLSAVATLLGTTQQQVRNVLQSWGPGKFDAELFLDGKAVQPGGASAATLIPPAFGLAGVNLHTWEGWGSVTHWNAFVANIEMHGEGTFFDPRLDDAQRFPIAAAAGFGHLTSKHDRITPKLAALHLYQLALPSPKPPPDSFDPVAAARGDELFAGAAGCTRCHVEPLYTEPGWNMHTAQEIGIDSFQADRGPDRRYRTTPLKGLWTHTRGGFYHDGRFATLLDVVDHYDAFFQLQLSAQDKNDLVQYLLSI